MTFGENIYGYPNRPNNVRQIRRPNANKVVATLILAVFFQSILYRTNIDKQEYITMCHFFVGNDSTILKDPLTWCVESRHHLVGFCTACFRITTVDVWLSVIPILQLPPVNHTQKIKCIYRSVVTQPVTVTTNILAHAVNVIIPINPLCSTLSLMDLTAW